MARPSLPSQSFSRTGKVLQNPSGGSRERLNPKSSPKPAGDRWGRDRWGRRNGIPAVVPLPRPAERANHEGAKVHEGGGTGRISAPGSTRLQGAGSAASAVAGIATVVNVHEFPVIRPSLRLPEFSRKDAKAQRPDSVLLEPASRSPRFRLWHNS